MYASPIWSKVSSAVDFGLRAVELSLLWMVFSAVGLVIVGVGPATAAAHSVARKNVLRTDVPVFRTFISTFRREFVRANQLAWVLMAVGLILAWDSRIALYAHPGILHLLVIPLFLVDGACAAVALYVFPLYVHRHLPRIWHYFRLAAVTAVLNPGRSLVMLALLYGWVFVLGGILPFVTIGFLVYMLTWLAITGSDRAVRLLDPGSQTNNRNPAETDASGRIEASSGDTR